MCGLVGIAGALEYRDEASMKRLLLLDFLRGTDSTGLASVRLSNEIMVAKAAVNPIDLFQFKKFDTVLTGASSKAFIGHNRAATLGKVNNNNSHPFQFGEVVGAHNGTLDRPSWTRLEKALGFETNVDSEAIIAGIDKLGIEETISLMEEGKTSQTGAWALTWYDGRDDTMNFLRNPHRPLWRAVTEDGKKIFWASEWPMIRAAFDLSGTEYKTHTNDKGHSYFEFAENAHYKVNATQLLNGDVKPNTFEIKPLKGREPPVYVQTMGYQYGQQGGTPAGSPPFKTDTHQQGTTGNHSKIQNYNSSTAGNKVTDLFAKDSDPFAGFVDHDRFLALAKHGCGWCGDEIHYSEKGVTIYDDLDHILCGGCSRDPKGVTRIYATPTRVQEYFAREVKVG